MFSIDHIVAPKSISRRNFEPALPIGPRHDARPHQAGRLSPRARSPRSRRPGLRGDAPGRAHFKDQLDRAATSIVLNIAEGAGEFSKDEKHRFYRIARRSATETAAILDVLERRNAVPTTVLQPARDLIIRVVSMLVRLVST
jgi:four helix bundle protein